MIKLAPKVHFKDPNNWPAGIWMVNGILESEVGFGQILLIRMEDSHQLIPSTIVPFLNSHGFKIGDYVTLEANP